MRRRAARAKALCVSALTLPPSVTPHTTRARAPPLRRVPRALSARELVYVLVVAPRGGGVYVPPREGRRVG